MDLNLFIIKHEHYRLAGLVRLAVCEYKGTGRLANLPAVLTLIQQGSPQRNRLMQNFFVPFNGAMRVDDWRSGNIPPILRRPVSL
jgi:hypothetical protein